MVLLMRLAMTVDGFLVDREIASAQIMRCVSWFTMRLAMTGWRLAAGSMGVLATKKAAGSSLFRVAILHHIQPSYLNRFMLRISFSSARMPLAAKIKATAIAK